MRRMRSSAPAMVVAVLLGLALGGGAVAAISIPDHSIGWTKLAPKVQKRILRGARVTESVQPLRVISGEAGPQGERGTTGPEGRSGTSEPRCELVKGECLIYSDDFWRLQAVLEPFETETGVYPEPPLCMKAVAEGTSDLCDQVVFYLYPDGTFGDAPWVLDPSDPKGWRLF